MGKKFQKKRITHIEMVNENKPWKFRVSYNGISFLADDIIAWHLCKAFNVDRYMVMHNHKMPEQTWYCPNTGEELENGNIKPFAECLNRQITAFPYRGL